MSNAQFAASPTGGPAAAAAPLAAGVLQPGTAGLAAGTTMYASHPINFFRGREAEDRNYTFFDEETEMRRNTVLSDWQ